MCNSMVSMGIAIGGMQRMCFPGSKFWGDFAPKIVFKRKILEFLLKLLIFQYFQNKVGKIRGEI